MLTSSISNTRWCHSVGQPCNFMDWYSYFGFGRCLLPTILGIWFCLWQMLLPLVFATCILFGWCCCHVALLYDRWWCNYHQSWCCSLFVCIGRCYCHLFLWLLVLPHFWFELCQRCTTVVVVSSLLADLIAKMVDGIAIVCVWQMLLPSGWCYCHCVLQFILADVIAWWLMECLPWVWMADVIANVADGMATGSMF